MYFCVVLYCKRKLHANFHTKILIFAPLEFLKMKTLTHAPKIWICTSKIIPDLWLVDLFWPIKKKFHTPPYFVYLFILTTWKGEGTFLAWVYFYIVSTWKGEGTFLAGYPYLYILTTWKGKGTFLAWVYLYFLTTWKGEGIFLAGYTILYISLYFDHVERRGDIPSLCISLY